MRRSLSACNTACHALIHKVAAIDFSPTPFISVSYGLVLYDGRRCCCHDDRRHDVVSRSRLGKNLRGNDEVAAPSPVSASSAHRWHMRCSPARAMSGSRVTVRNPLDTCQAETVCSDANRASRVDRLCVLQRQHLRPGVAEHMLGEAVRVEHGLVAVEAAAMSRARVASRRWRSGASSSRKTYTGMNAPVTHQVDRRKSQPESEVRAKGQPRVTTLQRTVSCGVRLMRPNDDHTRLLSVCRVDVRARHALLAP